ncbi:MAG TPA: hypothetical protein VKN73_09770 [Desulfosalsimonadaceae bacterium]|nr:hypothetical protein [Desulfosalsimonadaceae bacterium]
MMNPSPVFRKAILPWYDTTAACICVLGLMAVVLVVGIEGIRVAGRIASYHGYIWVPIVLVTLSCFVCVSIIFRVVRRYRDRFSF